MNDPDQTDYLVPRRWAARPPVGRGTLTVDEERSAADLTGGLVNLGFFTAALRRSARVWCLTAVVGL